MGQITVTIKNETRGGESVLREIEYGDFVSLSDTMIPISYRQSLIRKLFPEEWGLEDSIILTNPLDQTNYKYNHDYVVFKIT